MQQKNQLAANISRLSREFFKGVNVTGASQLPQNLNSILLLVFYKIECLATNGPDAVMQSILCSFTGDWERKLKHHSDS